MVLTIATGTYYHAYRKYKIILLYYQKVKEKRKYSPAAIPMAEETMIPVDMLTTKVPKNNAIYEMIDNQ